LNFGLVFADQAFGGSSDFFLITEVLHAGHIFNVLGLAVGQSHKDCIYSEDTQSKSRAMIGKTGVGVRMGQPALPFEGSNIF
jgi:hypothetical protein